MPFIPFKFKKANAPTRLAHFDAQPTWGDLASKIVALFDIPRKDVGVAYVDKYKHAITLNNEQELEDFYKSLDQSSEEIKFVVQDLRTPDGESTFSFVPVPAHVLYYKPACIRSRALDYPDLLSWPVIYHCSISRNHNYINMVNEFQSVWTIKEW